MLYIYSRKNILKTLIILLSLYLFLEIQSVRAEEQTHFAPSSSLNTSTENTELNQNVADDLIQLDDVSELSLGSTTEKIKTEETLMPVITVTDEISKTEVVDKKLPENTKTIKEIKPFERLVIEPVLAPAPQDIFKYPKSPSVPVPLAYKKNFKPLPPPPRPPRRVVRLDTMENIDSTSTLPVPVPEDLQTSTSTEDTVDVKDLIIEDTSSTSTSVEATSTDSSVGTSSDNVPEGDPVEIPDLLEVAPVILPKTDDATSSDAVLP